MPFIIATFYHFFDFQDFAEKRAEIQGVLSTHGLCGSLLLAGEGMNATLAGSREGVDASLSYLYKVGGKFEHKESVSEKKPFKRLRIRLKKETISIGEDAPRELVGEYIEPKDWNDFINDPDTILIDARNVYETHLGSFKGAVDPKTRNFKQLPAFVRKHFSDAKKKRIATFCTGGIRCEKFTSWLKTEGYENVYHLKGGILKYLEEIPESESAWEGECFVFDDRIGVGHGLKPTSTTTMCYGCGQPLKPEDRAHPLYKDDQMSCAYCAKNQEEKYGIVSGYSQP